MITSGAGARARMRPARPPRPAHGDLIAFMGQDVHEGKEAGMGAPRPAQSAPGDGTAGTGTPLILLAEPGSGVERTLVKRWLREVGVRPSTVLPLDGPGLDRSLAATPPDTVVTAARVAWLPRERGGERR